MLSNNKRHDTVKKSDWIILIVAAVILSSLYLYSDLSVTTAGGLNVWYSLAEGKLNSFYSYHYPGVAGSWLPDGVTGGHMIFLFIVFLPSIIFPCGYGRKLPA